MCVGLMFLVGANDPQPPRFPGRALVGTTRATHEPVYGTMTNRNIVYHIARRESTGWTFIETDEASFNFIGAVEDFLRYGV